ncbi:MAG: hypothetical protein LBM22_00315 [Endomicrobium sp.]|jgi:hypothetical protein|nr:hypothetical protein [Endomicrobium sp.]
MYLYNIKKKQTFSVSCFIVVIILFAICLTSFADDINMTAENIEYDVINKKLECYNNVNISFHKTRLSANNLNLFINKKYFIANGMVKIDNLANTIYADSLQYNYEHLHGHLVNGVININNFFIRAEKITQIQQYIYSLSNITLSNCDFDQPHVYFKSKNGKIISNDKLILYSTILYIGRIPIFYLPIIFHSLQKDASLFSNVQINIKPKKVYIYNSNTLKSNQKDKFKIQYKSNITLPINKHLTILLLYNNLGLCGINYGMNLKSCQSEDQQIKLDMTITNYKKNFVAMQIGKKKQFFLSPSISWAFNNKWFLRSQLSVFNGIPLIKFDYKNSKQTKTHKKTLHCNVNKKKNKIIDIVNILSSYFAISKQFNKIHVDIITEYLMFHKKYFQNHHCNYAVIPKIDICSFYNKGIYDTYHKFDLSLSNLLYTESINILDQFAITNINNLNYLIKKNLLVNKIMTLTTTLQVVARYSLAQYIFQHKDMTNFMLFNLNSLYKCRNYATFKKNNFLSECISSLNCKLRLYNWWDCNIEYYYKNFFKTHNINVSNNVCVLDNIQCKSVLLYTYNYNINNICQRQNFYNYNININNMTPFLSYTELVFTPYNIINLYCNIVQNLYPWKCNNYNMYFTVHDSDDNFCCTLGKFYQNNNHENIFNTKLLSNLVNLKVNLSHKWKLSYSLKTFTVCSHNQIERQLKLFRNIHCYRLGLIWKKKNKCNTFQLQLIMKQSKTSKLDENKNKFNNLLNYLKLK